MKQFEKQYRAKCLWRSTSLTLIVDAKDDDEAWQKAANEVKKMLGGMSCLEIKVAQV